MEAGEWLTGGEGEQQAGVWLQVASARPEGHRAERCYHGRVGRPDVRGMRADEQARDEHATYHECVATTRGAPASSPMTAADTTT